MTSLKCKWGDERDEFTAPAGRPAIDPATAALMARITALERHVKQRDDELKMVQWKANQAGVDLSSLPGMSSFSPSTAAGEDTNKASTSNLDSITNNNNHFQSDHRHRHSPPAPKPQVVRSGQALSFHLDPPLPRRGLGRSDYEGGEDDEDDELEKESGNGNGSGGNGSGSDDFGTEDTGKVLDQLSRELIHAPSERMPDSGGVNTSYFKALRRANHQFDPTLQGSKRREVLGVPENASSSRSNEELDQSSKGNDRVTRSSSSNSNTSGNGTKDAVYEEASSMIKALPNKQIRTYLIERYITDLQPMFPALHVPTFRREYEELEEIIEGRNKNKEMNLSNLALLFAVLQGMCDCLSLEDMKTIGAAKSLEEAIPLLESLHNSMARLLILDRFWLTPTLSGLQAFIISRHYYFNRNLHKHYSGQNLMAMRLAQTLGLHRLGSAEEDEKLWSEERALKEREGQSNQSPNRETDSPQTLQEALQNSISNGTGLFISKGKGKVKLHPFENSEEFGAYSHPLRETGRRVYTLICSLEWFLCTNASAPSAIRAGDSGVTTSLPLNIEDEDLEKSPLRPQDRNVPTPLSFLPIYTQISLTIARISEAINRGDGYRSVLAMHGELKAILDDLPFFFRYDNENGMSEETEEEIVERETRNEWFEKMPILRFQRCLIHHFVNWRFLSLHRMYMSRGYREPRYSLSTRSSIEAASRLIKARIELSRSMPDFYPPDWWSSRLHLFQAIATLQLDLLHYSTQPWNDKMASQQDLIGEGTTYLKSLITAAGGGSADGSPLLTTLATLKEMIFSRRSAAASNNPPSIASSSRSGIPQRESNERNSPTLRAASSIAGTATSSSSSSSLSAARAGGGGDFSKDPTQGIPALPAPLNNNPSNSVLLSSSPPLHQSQHYMSPPQMNRPFQPQPPNFNGTYSNSPQLSDSNHSRYGSSSMYLDPQVQSEPPISPHETDAFISILDNVMRGSAQGGINNPSMSNMSNSLGGGGGHTRSSSSLEAAMPTESMRARSQSHSNSSSYELRGGQHTQHTYNSLSQQQQQHHQHHQNSFQTHPNRAFTWGAEHHQAERNQQNQNQNSSPYQ